MISNAKLLGRTSKMQFCILIVLLSTFGLIYASERADSIYSFLCTKTAYRFSSNEDITDISQDESDSAEKVWMLIRHGTRNPSTGDIDNFKNRLPEIQSIIINANIDGNNVLNTDELALFAAWSPIVEDISEQQFLVAEGELENIEMAQRMQARYPNVLPSIFDNGTYLFKSSDSQRTRQSARYFATGLFGPENIQNVYFPEPEDEDQLILEFYKICSKWINEVDENPEALIERDLFEETDTFLETIPLVNQAIGLTDQLSQKDVEIMYKACAFETSWSRTASSPWCIPFELETIKVLAYAEDLEYYWVDGYGVSLNYEQACPAFEDMISFFEDIESDRKATLYFTHSGAVLKFIAHLGLFRDDEDLLHSNFATNQDRQWQTSKIGNFATNVAVILHDIDGSKKISVRQNEYVVRLPACPDTDLCDLEVVKEYYQESINNCDFDAICENNLYLY